MGKFDNIYLKSPRLIQNVLTSVYGAKREYHRHGGSYKNSLMFCKDSQWKDAEWFNEYQLMRLRDLLNFASHSVYYSALFKNIGLELSDINSLDDIKRIPILEKSTIRKNVNDLYTTKEFNYKTVEFHTSGSTGTPITIKMYLEDFRERMAYLERQRLWANVKGDMKFLTFSGRKIVPGNSNECFWRYNLFGKQLLLSIYHLHENNMASYLSKINEYNADIIEAYPSTLSVIASYIMNNQYSVTKPKAIFTTAETLSMEQRKQIEGAFGCQVFNYYASNEGAPFITQCEYGNLHANPETGVFEFLREDGTNAKPGEISELVVTSFTTRATPLIRYKIGDMAIYSSDSNCNCGRNMPVIKEIIGRIDDIFHTQYHGSVGRLSTSLKLLPANIKEAQIQQHTYENFTLLLATDDNISDDQLYPTIVDLKDKLGPVNINISFAKQIPRGANGKFRSQINLMERKI